MKKEKVYKILFIQLGEVYEIFAKNIYQSDMYAFLEVEEFIFGSDDQLVCLLYTSPSPRDEL